MNPVALSILSAKILSTLSFCDMPVIVVDSFPSGAMARTDGFVIEISKEIRPSEVRHAIPHEVAHIAYFRHGNDEDLRKYTFGQEPFATDYSRLNPEEHFAEDFARYVNGERVIGLRGHYVRRMLRMVQNDCN